MKRILTLVLSLALTGMAGALPLCRVDRVAHPGVIPGTYTVVVSTVLGCPENGYAVVRLVSGREYPWQIVTPGRPYVQRGVPWWWKGQWAAESGRLYTFKIPGMKPPWGRP